MAAKGGGGGGPDGGAQLVSSMSRKHGTANDWVNAVLEGAIRSKFAARSTDDGEDSGESRRRKELRLAQLYGSNSTSKLVRSRASLVREQAPKETKSLKTMNAPDGPTYVEQLEQDWSLHGPWYCGRNNKPQPVPASALCEKSFAALARQSGKVGLIDPFSHNPPIMADPYVPPVLGGPSEWPIECEYVSGSAVKPKYCQPYRPHSRFHNSAYSQLHCLPPPAAEIVPPPPADARGLGKIPAKALISRIPGLDPLNYSVADTLRNRPTSASKGDLQQKRPSSRSESPGRGPPSPTKSVASAHPYFSTVGGMSSPIRSATAPLPTLSADRESPPPAVDGDSFVLGVEGAPGWRWDEELGQYMKTLTPRIQRWQQRVDKATHAAHQKFKVLHHQPTVVSQSSRKEEEGDGAAFAPAFRGMGGGATIKPKEIKAESRASTKYCSSVTVLTSAKQDERAIKQEAEKKAKERELRATLKWKELGVLNQYLRNPARRRPGVDEIDELYDSLRRVCAEVGSEAKINRDRFWQLISATELPLVSANRLFSGFDIDRRDEMDIRVLVCALRLFKKSSEPIVDKLCALYDIYHVFDATENLRRAHIVSLLQTCADSELELDMLDKLAQRALTNKLGSKSLWAVDVSRQDFAEMLAENDMLVATFERQYKEKVLLQ